MQDPNVSFANRPTRHTEKKLKAQARALQRRGLEMETSETANLSSKLEDWVQILVLPVTKHFVFSKL